MAMTNFDVEFTKDGAVFDQTQLDALIAGLAPVTDLFVLSPRMEQRQGGCQGAVRRTGRQPRQAARSPEGADRLQTTLADFTKALGGREFAAVRIYWPSKKFTDEELIPGGGAASAQAEQENIAAVEKVLDRLKEDPRAARRSHAGPGSRQSDGEGQGAAAEPGNRRGPEGVRQTVAPAARSHDGRAG